MTLRTRIFLVYLLLVGGGFYFLIHRGFSELRPRYLESMEESLVDSANLLATALQDCVSDGALAPSLVRTRLEGAFARRFLAKVYSLEKRQVDLRLYVTDVQGRVLFDSSGQAEGEDYSHWLDISRTLRGEYGARATRTDPRVGDSLVLYVAAPIYRPQDQEMIGVVSLGKPTASINELARAAQNQLLGVAAAGAFLILLVGVLFSIWISTPVLRLTEYARAVRDGRPAILPRLAGREVGELRKAFAEMRAALDGKAYVERYIHSLTHELKSPLSAIRGAAEILAEQPPEADRVRFIQNIRTEADRVQRIIEQLLQLATLEARYANAVLKTTDLLPLAQECVDRFRPLADVRGIALSVSGVAVSGEVDSPLFSQALGNLVQNALDFTPRGGSVQLTLVAEAQAICIAVEDTGVGIPPFAEPQVFTRFFSLPRPDSGQKSSGLGLSLVREIVLLHHGQVSVANRPSGGVRAEIRWPRRSLRSSPSL